MPELRALFFDAGETLVHPHPSFAAVANGVLERLAPEVLPLDLAALGRHIEARTIHHRRGGRLVHAPRAAARQFWLATYREFLADHLAPERAARVADGLLAAFTELSNWALFPDALPTLAAVRPAVATLGILSNWEDWLDDLLLALNVRTHFDHILVSGLMGLEKPDPAIFQRALAAAGVAPHELAYVGDSLHHDIEPCLALGIRAVLIDRHDRHPDSPAYLRLTDLRDLPARLGLTAPARPQGG